MIVGVAGPNAAGKGEVIRLLAEQGYSAFSLSDVIREAVRQDGEEETRERMIETGTALRQAGGDGVLAERVLGWLTPGRDYAIDSIRHPAEVAVLKDKAPGFLLLWVDAPIALRFARLRARGRSGDPLTLARLQELEARELASPQSSGQQLLAVKELADRFLDNHGDLPSLESQLAQSLEAAGSGSVK